MLDDKIKSMLKKLFAVAENDASTDGEIDNAMRAAKVLMSRHQVERDDVFEGDDGEVDVTNVSYNSGIRYSLYTSICQWESYICKFITEFVPGVGFYIHRGQLRRNHAGMALSGKATKIIFYGPELDVKFCEELFDEIVYFVQAAAKLRYGKALSRGPAAAYAEGFAYGLYDANKREDKKLEVTTDSYALMVVNRGLAIKKGGKQWLAQSGIHLGKGRGSRSAADKSWDAYTQGKEDGATYQPSSTKKAGLLT